MVPDQSSPEKLIQGGQKQTNKKNSKKNNKKYKKKKKTPPKKKKKAQKKKKKKKKNKLGFYYFSLKGEGLGLASRFPPDMGKYPPLSTLWILFQVGICTSKIGKFTDQKEDKDSLVSNLVKLIFCPVMCTLFNQ